LVANASRRIPTARGSWKYPTGCTTFANTSQYNQKQKRRRSMTDIIRAWKDEEYRLSLTEEQRALLPDNPAGLLELSEADLESVQGGFCNSFMGCTVGAGNCNNNFSFARMTCDQSCPCPVWP
jgi:mersacidin/lichenicidin family type 2 lantibiotic